MKSGLVAVAAAAAIAFQAASATAAEASLDYEFFKARVEPIFLNKREGHARCFVCHSDANNAFRLQKPSGKNHTWTEEESRKNFAAASALVTPGSPDKSHLLMYPLAPEAGGSIYHSGGRQFSSKDSAEWKTIAAWVNGAKLNPALDKK
ncbi:MAG TPA: hypothetical protein VKF40_02105 [Burkholderiales bacterium]|nr:hypothetical protein [Burkholderiales bacterium]